MQRLERLDDEQEPQQSGASEGSPARDAVKACVSYLFAIAGAANLTPEKDEEAGSRLRTQGNMVEWAFVCLTDKLEELKGKPATERHDELIHWLATFDRTDDDTIRDARTASRLNSNNTKLPPKA